MGLNRPCGKRFLTDSVSWIKAALKEFETFPEGQDRFA
jgi:hypothetical protein